MVHFFKGLWLFSIFPFSTSSTLYIFLVVFFTHSSFLTTLAAYTPSTFFPSIFLSDLASYTFCHTQFFTPFSTSIPFFSVMLISFPLLTFSSSSFLCIWLLEFAFACCLYLLVPFEEKLDFSTRWVVIFFHLFSLFPPLDVESLPPAFYLFTLFLWLSCIFFDPSSGPSAEQFEKIFFAFTFFFFFFFFFLPVGGR